ncbi:dihydrodipicolinate synthase family protein [Paenarthrobacter sp. NPDC090522]|uniref:dihydrodipicolinate synthase family protein n=1 Tax=Paenarthrobacter sp. NPDC090522 TaxID=3364383 RepID=UPI003813BA3F
MNLKGIISPVITPFTEHDEVDFALYEQHVDRLLAAGVHGVSPGGSTGEGAALTDSELSRMVALAKQKAGDRPVVAGVIRSSTQAALQTAKAARDSGADALMITPVFYNVLVPNDEGNIDFYSKISEEVGLPIIIYNVVPQNTISPELFKRMRETIPNVVGVKQSVGGIQALYAMRLVDREALVYAATDEMLYSCFSVGADGAISAILALYPELSVQLWNLNEAGKHEEALRIQDQMHEVWMQIIGPQFPSRIKEALHQHGVESGFSRSPASPVDETTRAAIANALGKTQLF